MSERTPGDWHVAANGIDVRSGPIGGLAYVSTAGARGRTLAEAKANARFIAAGPRMQAAIEKALDVFGGERVNGVVDDLEAMRLGAIIELYAAVADATGRL
jgi:hypothetical protein